MVETCLTGPIMMFLIFREIKNMKISIENVVYTQTHCGLYVISNLFKLAIIRVCEGP